MRYCVFPIALACVFASGCALDVGGGAGTEQAATAFVAKINFQLAGAPVPSGYVADEGRVYAARNGLTYGWNSDHTSLCRDRNLVADQRLDTLCHFRDAETKWELAVPNGSYHVTVSVGDAAFTSDNTIAVEGVTYWSHLRLGAGKFASATKTVAVKDGRLTIDNGANVFPSTKIDYVEVSATIGPGGDVFYIAPSGSDANDCSTSARCATVAGVLAKTKFGPGDVILLGDGTYTDRGIDIDCATNPQKLDGTAASPITIRAEHERQAHLTSTKGHSVLVMRNCAYWAVEGLRVSQADFATTKGQDVVELYDSPNIAVRYCLMSRDNLLNSSSSGGFLFLNTPNFIVEDNEFYDFRRHAIDTKHNSGGIARRNYCNPRGAGGSGTCVTLYPGSNIIVEDNAAEGNLPYGFDSMPFDENNTGDRWLGNIGVNLTGGLLLLHSRCDGSIDGSTLDAVVRDSVAVGGAGHALWSRSAQVVARHASAFGGTNQGFIADQETCSLVDNRFEVYDSLAVNNGVGYYATADVVADTFALDRVAAFGNDTSFSPASDPRITGTLTSDPKLGTARVCVPTSSPLHGAASDGGDLGANVLYRYENGVKTTKQRWVTNKPASCPTSASGIYPYGMRACVPGVNDAAATSLAGLADRLGMTKTQVETACGAGAAYFP